jgi:hypothetical protein
MSIMSFDLRRFVTVAVSVPLQFSAEHLPLDRRTTNPPMIKTVLAAILAATLAVMSLPAAAAPAAQITVCNASSSVDALYVYNNQTGYSTYVQRGICRNGIDDAGGMARVDVDVGGYLGDVDSWHKADIGHSGSGGYGPCYNNETESSNPYSTADPGFRPTTLYETFGGTGC